MKEQVNLFTYYIPQNFIFISQTSFTSSNFCVIYMTSNYVNGDFSLSLISSRTLFTANLLSSFRILKWKYFIVVFNHVVYIIRCICIVNACGINFDATNECNWINGIAFLVDGYASFVSQCQRRCWWCKEHKTNNSDR